MNETGQDDAAPMGVGVRVGVGDEAAPGRGQEVLDRWFLTDRERANPATGLSAWTRGNLVRPLVDGAEYFPALARALEGTTAGDLVVFADWQSDPDELLRDAGPTIAGALTDAAARGVVVKGLVWRSPWDWQRVVPERNRHLAQDVGGGAEVLLDQRVRTFGSHHQKFVVIRYRGREQEDVAFVGSLDIAHSRRDDAEHRGDRQSMSFGARYGRHPAWHDVHAEVRGPAVAQVEAVFRERWHDPAPLSLLPWQVLQDVLRRRRDRPRPLPGPTPAPPATGTCAVQLLRTYPRRFPRYPFAPSGERSAAAGLAKALGRARRLVYVEDQFFWSRPMAEVFAQALRSRPELHLVLVLPRQPKRGGLAAPPLLLGQVQALEVVRAAGGDRVHVFDVENHAGLPVYVHAKVCVIDDVWAAVRSDNLNQRSWTHDSELGVAVLDEDCDEREPRDPAGTGDGARVFARSLRLRLLREHLDRDSVAGSDSSGGSSDGEDADLLDPAAAVDTLRRSAEALEAWHAGGRVGPRPPGKLRVHRDPVLPRWQRVLSTPVYRVLLDPAVSDS